MLKAFYEDKFITLLQGNSLEILPQLDPEIVQTVVTSPPYYGLRNYGNDEQIGLESSPKEFIVRLCEVFDGVKRVMRKDATIWLNLGDSYAGSGKGQTENGSQDPKQPKLHGMKLETYKPSDGFKPKDLMMIPHRVAIALQDAGFWVRSDIVWHKPNPMPESVTDRPTKSHEYIFLLSKDASYFYDAAAISEEIKGESYERAMRGVSDSHKNLHIPGQTQHSMHRARANGDGYQMPERRNKRSVWTVNVNSFVGAHFATFPPKLIEPCIKAGSRPNDVVLDPFAGSGTTLLLAKKMGRRAIGIELNPIYCEMIANRIERETALPLLDFLNEDE